MSSRSADAGFTLMELIVVLFLLSIMLTFAMPEFSGNIIRDDTETTLNWIIFNVSKLKKEARHQGKDMFMCISTDTNTISIKGTPSDPDISDTDIRSEFTLPEDVRLDGVEFNSPGQEADTDGCIQFYKKGYSDHAIIHLSDNDGRTFSCLIQPFLHKVTLHEDDIRFE
ncbi:prepilin-type N-terminal cleavage/methylation domain-containing protein [Desulfobacula sp.]|uniref:pilus assembly FimT family protein n=1 Tax=Desulfobacula sp. TaxID=2593537 RepID=UPI002639A49D|nr:prepilin-type N-terminal cleavage/methylation domain-containing protein [Desulfobacula sp.]